MWLCACVRECVRCKNEEEQTMERRQDVAQLTLTPSMLDNEQALVFTSFDGYTAVNCQSRAIIRKKCNYPNQQTDRRHSSTRDSQPAECPNSHSFTRTIVLCEQYVLKSVKRQTTSTTQTTPIVCSLINISISARTSFFFFFFSTLLSARSSCSSLIESRQVGLTECVRVHPTMD